MYGAFEVRTAVSLTTFVSLVTPYRLVEMKGGFREKLNLFHKDRELRDIIPIVGAPLQHFRALCSLPFVMAYN